MVFSAIVVEITSWVYTETIILSISVKSGRIFTLPLCGSVNILQLFPHRFHRIIVKYLFFPYKQGSFKSRWGRFLEWKAGRTIRKSPHCRSVWRLFKGTEKKRGYLERWTCHEKGESKLIASRDLTERDIPENSRAWQGRENRELTETSNTDFQEWRSWSTEKTVGGEKPSTQDSGKKVWQIIGIQPTGSGQTSPRGFL